MHKDLGLGWVIGLGLITWGCGDAPSAKQTGRAQVAAAAASPETPAPDGRAEGTVQIYLRLHGPAAAALVPAGTDPATPAVAKATRRRVAELAAIHAELQERLAAQGVPLIAKLSRLTNALHVKATPRQIAAIRRWPEVAQVERVPSWRRSLQTTLDIVGAPAVWTGTTPYHGDGIRIGIVDSGIDYYHADFGGTGNAADYINDHPGVVEPGTFPAGRVVAGWDLVGNAYNPDAGWDETTPDDDPVDCGGHGTWVAGVAAGGGVLSDGSAFEGPYDQSLDLASFRVAPGVAPKASLYALKVFGCDGPTFVVSSALERASDPDEDGQFDDRLDVVNLSLGSTFGFHAATDVEVMRNLIGLGTVVVAAAGNAGQTYYSAGAPGAMADPIAAGGVAALPLTLHVDTPGSIAGDYMAIEGGFSEPLDSTGAVSGPVVYAEPNLACGALTNPGQIAGTIALIDRGTCLFVDKFQHALDAGAIGVVVANYENEIFAMGGDGHSALPGVMISHADGLTIKGELGNGVTATLSATAYPGPDAIRPWWTSSRGPSSIGHILRPDVSAPADSIKSASVGTGTQGNAVSGTSFATPFVAGGVALLLQALPMLTPHEVKALLMASAAPMDDAGSDAPVSWQGAGRMDLPAALEQQVTAAVVSDGGEVSVSFGAHVTDEPVAETRTVTVTNRGAAGVTYDLSLAAGNTPPGVSFTLGAEQLTVAAGQSETFSISFALDPATLGAPGPDPGTPPIVFEVPRHTINEAWGRIVLADTDPNGTQSFTLPYHAVVRAAASRSASQASGCWDGDDGPLEIVIEGSSAHPAPVVSAFELGAVHDEDADSATDPKIAEKDLRAVGIATNAATATSFAEVRLHFAVAIAGQWASPAGSYVAIEVDRDDDDEPDTITVPLALTLDGPYADAFVGATYDYSTCENPRNLRTCEQSGDSIYANLVPADVQDTQPFLNGVLVLSASAQDLGLDSSTTTFQYRAISFDETEPWPGMFNATDWASYDFESPGLDTASAAPTEGIPLYAGDEPVTVVLPPDEPAPPSVLLLHHTNVAGARFEVVDPATFRGEPITITTDLPAAAARDTTLAQTISLTNGGTYVARALTVVSSVSGASLEGATPSQGSCTIDPSLACELGDLLPGATATVALELTTESSATSANLDLSVTSAGSCESTYSAAISLTAGTGGLLEATGGCDCRSAPVPGRQVAWPLPLILLLGATRRHRRLSRRR